MQGGKDISTKPVGFGGAQGLQVNVGLPSPGGVADKVSWRPHPKCSSIRVEEASVLVPPQVPGLQLVHS